MKTPAAPLLLPLLGLFSVIALFEKAEMGINTTPTANPHLQAAKIRRPESNSRCDLNRDGKVDVLDLELAIQAILGNGPAFDLDCSGSPTVLDLQLLVNVVLGDACPSECASTTTSSSSTTSRPSTTTTTTLPAVNTGQANLQIFFTPNPAADNGTGRFQFDVYLVETGGVAVTLTSLTIGSGTANQIDQIVPSRRIEAGGHVARTYVHFAQNPLIRIQDLPWEIRGYDELGHEDLAWRSHVRLAPFPSTQHGNLHVFFQPNPAIREDEGTGANLLVARETNGIGVTLTSLAINGIDCSSDIRVPRIPPQSSVGALVTFPAGATPGDYLYVFKGNDDNGHKDLSWSAINRLPGYIELLSGIPRNHRALNAGYLPFQFRIFVPQGSASLTVRFEGPQPPWNSLNLYLRAVNQVTRLEDPFPPNPVADFSFFNLGTATQKFDAQSRPPLQTGVSYYLLVHSALYDRLLPFTLTATVAATPAAAADTAN